MGVISPIATDSSGNPIGTGSTQVLGKDDFLELLVTKLQYQDPLEPTSDEDFIAQLAQFSTLEQTENLVGSINESNQLSYLQMQSLNNSMSTNMIGQEVTADYSGAYLKANGTATINYTTVNYAEKVTFTILNENGEEVAEIVAEEVAPGNSSITWDGKDKLGNTVPEGYYTFEAVATDANGGTSVPELSLVGLVDSISYRDGAAYLSVNGIEIALGDITGVGVPGTWSGEDEG